MKMNKLVAPAVCLLSASALIGCKEKKKDNAVGIDKVKHVVVIYLENRSFDNLYGEFEGANGLANAKKENVVQVDSTGKPYQFLPAITGSSAFPTNLPNNYFNIEEYVPADQKTPDLLHLFWQEQMQIDSGKMDRYALYNNSAGLTMGHYKTNKLPMAKLAKEYTLCDNFFHSAFGGSFLNHQWLIAAASPVNHSAPQKMIIVRDSVTGRLINDGDVTQDGYVVNTCFTVNTPHPKDADPTALVPQQTHATIGDRLSDAKVSWAWYSGGWNDAAAGKDVPFFQYHHQPFAYFAKYADGTPGRKEHLKDETDFIKAAKDGELPAVSFVKPVGRFNEHSGYAVLTAGEKHTIELINDVMDGPNGDDAVIIVTYDENGGFWDHVAPPKIDSWGPGTRVPAIIISKFAKKGFIDHTQYETVSILSFIEKRWHLQPLTERDKKADPLSNAFQF